MAETNASSSPTLPPSNASDSRSTESSSTKDHTPVNGYRPLTDIYSVTQLVEINEEELMFAGEEPTTFQEAKSYRKWVEAMIKEI